MAKAEEVVPHSRANIVSFELDDSSTEGESYRLTFSDSDEMENYYRLIIKALKYEMTNTGGLELINEEIVDYELIGQMNFPYFNTEVNKEWTAIYPESEAYFQYHKSIEAQLTDQNYLTDPSRIYNNIENGFGNFSAYSVVIKEAERRGGE